MKIDGAGRMALVCGADSPVLDAIAAALAGNGCEVARAPAPAGAHDLLIYGLTLKLEDSATPEPAGLDEVAQAMLSRGSGRIILILSAVAAVPARRFPDASISAAAMLTHVRTLAMRCGPTVLVNAVGCGAIAGHDGDLLAGDDSLLSHVPTGEAGDVDDIVNAALFLCDLANSYMTGQLLAVDGGWSAGYGRNF